MRFDGTDVFEFENGRLRRVQRSFDQLAVAEALQARAATAEYERLQREVFPDHELVLLHGRMSPREKAEAMERFAAGAAHVLVATTVIEVGDLRLDPAARRAWRGGTELELSTREFALLELLMRRPGIALTRLQILDGAWDMAFESRSNVIDVYVRYLREKIDRPFGRHAIETVRGVGYRLRADGG